jgi:RNA polymerase sigma-70 factor (ECF subfamily)
MTLDVAIRARAPRPPELTAVPTLRATGPAGATRRPGRPAPDEGVTLARLRRGDMGALAELVDLYQLPMTRLAMNYVHDIGAAQDVVQETWVAVIEGISGFEGRSLLRNWIYSILVNLAMARGRRDARLLPFASCVGADEDDLSVPSMHFTRNPGARSLELAPPWGAAPRSHRTLEDDRCERETFHDVVAAIAELPLSQRAVIYLRDVCGLTSTEVCERLGISDVAQRVRLHRARVCVRDAVFGPATDGSSTD